MPEKPSLWTAFRERLLCPRCGAGGLEAVVLRQSVRGIDRGVLRCLSCGEWYPIVDDLLDLLVGDLRYLEDRRTFWADHRAELEARGIPAPCDSAGPAMPLQRGQQEHFDWYAENESQTYSAYEAGAFWRAADRIAFEGWRSDLRPGSWILDVGCAQGRSAAHVIDAGCVVVGVDVSKALVRQAIDRFRVAAPDAQAIFFAADASSLPIRSEAFDVVLVYGVLHHLPDPRAACSEIARVLRPGGVYLGSENNRTVFRWVFDAVQRWLPLWHEEAGPEALISETMLRESLEPRGLLVETRSSVFVLPHLVNRFSASWAYRIVRWTDVLFGSLPWIRRMGGLLLVRARRTECAGAANADPGSHRESAS